MEKPESPTKVQTVAASGAVDITQFVWHTSHARHFVSCRCRSVLFLAKSQNGRGGGMPRSHIHLPSKALKKHWLPDVKMYGRLDGWHSGDPHPVYPSVLTIFSPVSPQNTHSLLSRTTRGNSLVPHLMPFWLLPARGSTPTSHSCSLCTQT